MSDRHRDFKDRLYGQPARLGKALSSPHRLEMLELLAQGERTVDSLATEIGLSLANASQHLHSARNSGDLPAGRFLYADTVVANELSESISRDIDLWTG